jgi:hypothetical protein
VTVCANSSGGGITYAWNTGQASQCINVSSSGTYSVTVTNSSGCTSYCSMVLQAAACRGSEETYNDGVTLYPNPTDGDAMIVFTSQHDARYTLQVVDPAGRVIKQMEGNVTRGTNEIGVHTKSLANGLYFIRLMRESETIVKPLLKQ